MNPFIKPFLAKTRATRLEYAIYGLILIAYYYASFQYNTWSSINVENYHLTTAYKALHLIDFIAFYVGLTVVFRRLHDLNKGKKVALWSLTIIGIIPLLYLLTFKKGTTEDNEYGQAKELSNLEKPIITLYVIASIAFCAGIWFEFRKVYDSMSEWQETAYEVDKSTKIIERLYSDTPRQAAFRVLLICQGKQMGFLIYPMKKNPINPKDPMVPFSINTESTTVSIYSTSENLRNKFSIASDLEDKFISFDFLPNLDRQKILNEEIEITFKDYSSAYQVKFDMKGQKVASLIKSCN
jgi:uncharacterized membrane protein YhaH (DUF805 family)